MRGLRGDAVLLSLLVAAAGCSFEPPADVPDDDDGVTIDAAPTDGDVEAPAMLTSSQAPHDFDAVTVSQSSAVLQVVVQNVGDLDSGPVTVTLGGSDPNEFEVVPGDAQTDCVGRVLSKNLTCVAQVRFHPSTAGAKSASLDIQGDPGGTVSIALTGTGLTPGNLEITAGATLDFSSVEVGTSSTAQTIDVRNSGGTATAALTVALGDATNYRITTDTCGGNSLSAGASCSLSVAMEPDTVGSHPTQVSIRESATVGVSASASGAGSARIAVDKTGVGTISSDPSGIACGPSCTTQTASFSQTPVTLTASAPSGYAFDGWAGPCNDASLTCSVPLTTALTTVSATFHQLDCEPNTIVCDDATAHYVDCSASGSIEVEMDCPLGCASGVEKCLDVNPSNSLATQLDLAAGGPALAFTGSSTINTTSGAVTNNGSPVSVTSAVVGGIRVFPLQSLSIAGTLKVTGTYRLAFVVDGSVLITGTLDVSADGSTAGPGYHTGTCAGQLKDAQIPAPGGGGGGRYNAGGSGGAGGSVAGGTGGVASVENTLVPLVGGCAGGNSTGRFESMYAATAFGGGGGGAVQITSRTSITLMTGGRIDASGGGGGIGFISQISAYSGGGGGGSGGGVLLEAPQVTLDGSAVVISTKGGGGGGTGSGATGADGGVLSGAATGGSGGGNPAGGNGGTETLSPTNGATASGESGGGGGGSVGQARFNTQQPLTLVSGAVIRSRYTTGSLVTRQVP